MPEKRRVIREASKGEFSAPGLVEALELSFQARLVRQVLQDVPFLNYKRMARQPAIKEHHKKERVKWAMEKMTWRFRKWSTVVWSDEKKVQP